MVYSVKEIIKKRRSVRTFDERPISSEDRQALEEAAKSAVNPFGVDVQFRFLNAEKHDLSSAVIVGADEYVGAKVKRGPGFEIAYGYSLEKFCLDALSIGVGTVILAGTLSRRNFEKAMQLQDGEIMPAATPIGYIAGKKSVRERMMRGAIKANERKDFGEIFFENSFEKGLTAESAGEFAEALEMARWAPSAVNKQPWRAVVCGNRVHFYERRSKGFDSDEGDLQKIDVGIALAHFDLTMKENGKEGRFAVETPEIKCDDKTEYIISYEI